MSKLDDLKKAAEDKLATVHADVVAYVSALETKIATNKFWLYGGGAVLVLFVIWVVFHKH